MIITATLIIFLLLFHYIKGAGIENPWPLYFFLQVWVLIFAFAAGESVHLKGPLV
jgi:hypothetical protein